MALNIKFLRFVLFFALFNYKSNAEKIIVVSIIDEPFLMINNIKTENSTENDQYIGYCSDLTRKLSQIANFTYELKIVKDKRFGIKDENGIWNGIVGELIRNEADLAVAPLTITSKREADIDFTLPFMNVGISVMIKKQAYNRFVWFISPYDAFWLVILIGYVCLFIILCLTNANSSHKFEMKKSLALWFFTLVIIGTYSFNYAAFVTIEKIKINSVEDLIKQGDVHYGIVENSSTKEFFKNSNNPVYSKMWNYMRSWGSDFFVKNITEGFNKVKESEGNYAFLLESSMNEYLNERSNCDTMKLGHNLDSKGYGIATATGSPLKERINMALLQLKEQGYLEQLKYKWWNEQSKCKNNDENPKVSFHFSDVAILLYIIILGVMVSVVIGIFEFLFEFH